MDWYDYGARMYDPSLGRFHTMDPLSEAYSFQSPFAYAANNPISNTDFLGMSPLGVGGNAKCTINGMDVPQDVLMEHLSANNKRKMILKRINPITGKTLFLQ